MKATAHDHLRLEAAIQALVAQLRALGAGKLILFGSLARKHISLFSDIDLLVLFDEPLAMRLAANQAYRARL